MPMLTGNAMLVAVGRRSLGPKSTHVRQYERGGKSIYMYIYRFMNVVYICIGAR